MKNSNTFIFNSNSYFMTFSSLILLPWLERWKLVKKSFWQCAVRHKKMMKKRDFFQTIKPFAITQPWNGKRKKNEILPAYPTLFRSTTTGTNYYAKKMLTQFILTFLLTIADAMWCLTNAKLICDVRDFQSKPRLTWKEYGPRSCWFGLGNDSNKIVETIN